MCNVRYLPDQNHIYRIRKKLWSGQEYGNVSVMVGSGFSLNAEKTSNSSSLFLTWTQLVKRMKKDLYPNKKNEGSNATSDSLKIASQYELVFGRQALDELIMEVLPDENYVPAKLHKLLLSLPWSDVFTTNYDTLLERTRPYIYDRKYDLALTISDLPDTNKPRIIKLHGSFPSQRPFIITEEDYRTYPKKFAAFVNTVQQSVMENILCLIGFSGDDPNFLNWIGWVRDNLGNNTPPIYFCGFISSTQKQVLKSRGIIPIDFSPLFSETNFPGILKYKRALEWFLLNLKYGKKPNPVKWPDFSKKTLKPQKDHLPYIPESITSYPKEKYHKGNISLDKEGLLELLNTWKKSRNNYPGWIIAPKNCRDKIWNYTKGWIRPIFNSLEKLELPESVYLLYELNWRLNVSLKPIFIDWAEKIRDLIIQINPFSIEIEDPDAKCTPETDPNLNWQRIRNCWVEIIFTLIKRAREDQDLDEFNLWMDKLKKIINIDLEWEVKWYYEKSLFYLSNFNQKELNNTLDDWPETNNKFPFWEAKRASLIAELGDLKKSERILEESLDTIKFSLKGNKHDLNLLSKEGWIMVGLKSLKENELKNEKVEIEEYSERWSKLSEYHCNPWQEIKVITSILKTSDPELPSKDGKSVVKSFDPGKVTQKISFKNSLKSEEWISFSFVIMLERAGIPIMCGRFGFGNTTISSAKWIEPYSPLWSLSLMIRTGKAKETHKWFDRTKVANFSNEQIKYFYNLFKPSLEQAINDIKTNYSHDSFSSRILPSLIEITSRLSFRFSAEQREILLNLFMKIYEKSIFRNLNQLNTYITRMFERILFAMTNKQIVDKISELLNFPIPGEKDFNVSMENEFVEPFDHISWTNDFMLGKDYDRSTWGQAIDNLVNIMYNSTTSGRRRSFKRLEKLYIINGLTQKQEKMFKEAIWAQKDDEFELPININLYSFSFLFLPGAKENNVKYKLKEKLKATEIPSLHTKKDDKIVYSGGKKFEKYCNNLLKSSFSYYLFDDKRKSKYINWTTNEAEEIMNKIIKWWESEKEFILNDQRIKLFFNPQNHAKDIVNLISYVILPNLDNNNSLIINKVKRFLTELEDAQVNILKVLPMTLFLELYSVKEIKFKLRHGLNSFNKGEVKAALYSCLYWGGYSIKKDIKPIPNELLNDWIYKIYNRKNPELDTAIRLITLVLKNEIELLNKEHIYLLCETLEFLKIETDLSQLKNNQQLRESYIPELKEGSSKLAYYLKKHFEKNKQNIPNILNEWESISNNSSLPEVKKIWDFENEMQKS